MKRLKYLLIGALLLLVACHAKKLSYRDPFYFGDNQTRDVQIATTATIDTIKRTGDWKTDVYSTSTTVNNLTDSLYFRVSGYKLDTVKVIGYCLDTATLKVEWRRLYGVYGWGKPSVNFNGLIIYHNYLMPDRKTPSIYKVIYSINSK